MRANVSAMPIKDGYSRLTVEANINYLCKLSYPKNRAIAECLSNARRCYFERNPDGALPLWLAFPKEYRLREHYDPDGKPLRLENARRNPAPRHAAEVKAAARRYTAFTGHQDVEVKRMRVPGLPGAALAIGSVLSISYETIRDGERENYVHRFTQQARPLLASSPDGRQLYLLGGAYNFGSRGIVDKK